MTDDQPQPTNEQCTKAYSVRNPNPTCPPPEFVDTTASKVGKGLIVTGQGGHREQSRRLVQPRNVTEEMLGKSLIITGQGMPRASIEPPTDDDGRSA